MMLSNEIWRELDRRGLVPSVHWAAAPREWREALSHIEQKIDDELHNILALNGLDPDE